jgi:hypothetical protein
MPFEIDESEPRKDELDALLQDVTYEFEQFRYSASASLSISSQQQSLALSLNAHIESMLIHARCLVDFFWCERKKDDVVASDYISNWSPKTDGGQELEWLEENLGRFIDKRVAHLTAYRCRVPKEKDAQLVDEVRLKMETLVRRFAERLDEQSKATT